MIEIRENEEKETIIMGDQEIKGFLDDDKYCLECSGTRIYYENYDSFFCPQCNVWLESVCSDLTCDFCRSRPTKPLN